MEVSLQRSGEFIQSRVQELVEVLFHFGRVAVMLSGGRLVDVVFGGGVGIGGTGGGSGEGARGDPEGGAAEQGLDVGVETLMLVPEWAKVKRTMGDVR